MKKISGVNLRSLNDELIKQKLFQKNVEITRDVDEEYFPTTIKGKVTGFYCCSVNNVPNHNIAGVKLDTAGEITFTDDMIINIED